MTYPCHSPYFRPPTSLVTLAAVLSLSMFGCERVFYYPDQRDRGSPSDDGLAFEDVHFTTSDGLRLHGWFLPAQPGKIPSPRGTVLHLHGNAANITGHFPFVSWMPAAGFNVLTIDYRGYGRSEGTVSREGTIRDARAALDYLRGRADVDAKRIISSASRSAVRSALHWPPSDETTWRPSCWILPSPATAKSPDITSCETRSC